MEIPVRWQLESGYCHAYEKTHRESTQIHGHHHFLLTLVTAGEGVQTLNGIAIPFGPGDLFLLSPADFHKNTLPPDSSYTHYCLKFTYELLDARLSNLCALDKLPLHLCLSGEAADTAGFIFRQLIAECGSDREQLGSRAYLQALVEQLMILVLRQLKREEQTCPEPFINRALGYLYSHFSENITVGDAAAYVGYTPNYFNTCFHRQMGLPFGEYLRQMRLNYAENLLRCSQLPVTEVAYESGFGSLSYFSRCFRERYGDAPQQYRKTVREKEEL